MHLSRLLAGNLALCSTWIFLFSTFQAISAAPAKPGNPFKDPKNPFDEDNSDVEVLSDDSKHFGDGPTSDRSPGIGVEFESSQFVFVNKECKKEPTFASKGKDIDGRAGKDWSLTVDTTENMAGHLTGEYILNGKTIKLGSGRAKQAATEVKKDLDDWEPSANSCDVELLKPVNDQCKTWSISKPTAENGYKKISWLYQITAPIPLSGINALFQLAKTSGTSPLLPGLSTKTKRMVWVNKDFFQSAPNNMCEVDDDVLGFFSLLLSYVKPNELRDPGDSPKHMSTIMPRTDFVTIYNDVKSKIHGDLYELARVLLCYKNIEGEEDADFDSMWCDGSADSPKPKSNIDEKVTFKIEGTNPHQKKDETVSFTLQDWIEGLQGKGKKLEEANKADGTTGAKDLMAYYDRWIDGQIGGLKDAKEHLYMNNKQEVPLFEFRDIGSSSYDGFPKVVDVAEKAVLEYHKH